MNVFPKVGPTFLQIKAFVGKDTLLPSLPLCSHTGLYNVGLVFSITLKGPCLVFLSQDIYSFYYAYSLLRKII